MLRNKRATHVTYLSFLKPWANWLHRIRWSLLDLARVNGTQPKSVRERHRKYLSGMRQDKRATHEICVVLKAMRRKRATHETYSSFFKPWANWLHRIRWSLLDLTRVDGTQPKSVRERHRKYLSGMRQHKRATHEICVEANARYTCNTFVVL